MKTQSFVLPHGQQALLDALAQLDPRERYTVKVEKYKHKKERSLGLNAYYFGYVVPPLAQFMGESEDECHTIICKLFFGEVVKEFRGIKHTKPRRTTTTNEQGERDVLEPEPMRCFVAFAENICAEMGVRVEFEKREAA